MRFASAFALLAVTLVIFVGCGRTEKKDLPPLEVVNGMITVDGKRLRAGKVTFVPESDSGSNANIQGKITARSIYSMTTDGRLGVAPGRYKIAVELPEKAGADGKDVALPSRYTSPETSKLIVEVPGKYDLDLKTE